MKRSWELPYPDQQCNSPRGGGDPPANALIVVNLATGESWRRLHEHPST